MNVADVAAISIAGAGWVVALLILAYSLYRKKR